jgi:hypothetical protein
MENGSVIVPRAQGTYGSMARNMLRGKPFNEGDASSFKNWKFAKNGSASNSSSGLQCAEPDFVHCPDGQSGRAGHVRPVVINDELRFPGDRERQSP